LREANSASRSASSLAPMADLGLRRRSSW
jgi:hypothetical protein